jgi:hypothetical protein
VSGDDPGADDADQGVGSQGVDGGRHHPDGQVAPSWRGRDRVHGQADADACDVQRAGADCALAVQGQGDAERGEDQCADVGNAGLQRGDHGVVLDGADQDVLRVPADRRCRDRENG